MLTGAKTLTTKPTGLCRRHNSEKGKGDATDTRSKGRANHPRDDGVEPGYRRLAVGRLIARDGGVGDGGGGEAMTTKETNKTAHATLTLTVTYENMRLIDVVEAAREATENCRGYGRVEGFLDLHHTGRIYVGDLE